MVKFGVVLLLVIMMNQALASVKIDDGKLIYSGEINAQQNAALFALYNQANIKPTALYINSGGGLITEGMALGRFVRDNQLAVHVSSFCFSSCANYVIVAGSPTYFSAKAVVGWHGNAASAYWRDSDIDAMVGHLDGEEKQREWQRLRQHYDEFIKQAVADEKAFYATLTVSPDIMSIGLLPEFVKAAKQFKARGWTYDISSLNRLDFFPKIEDNQAWSPQSPAGFPLLTIQLSE